MQNPISNSEMVAADGRDRAGTDGATAHANGKGEIYLAKMRVRHAENERWVCTVQAKGGSRGG